MKTTIILILIALCTVSACSDEEPQLPVITPQAEGIFTDENGKEYHWVRYGNLEWMTDNLDVKLTSEDEEDNTGCEVSREEGRDPIDKEQEIEKNYKTFGCLYTYDAALQAVPEGWRIPSDEDWQSLESIMGMPSKELNSTDWRGNNIGTLLQQQKEGTNINLRVGGMGEYDAYGTFHPYFLYIYGFYWTATKVEGSSNSNYARQIGYYSNKIARVPIDKGKILSVRLVRDASNNN